MFTYTKAKSTGIIAADILSLLERGDAYWN